jgi:hypothetical protein
VRCVAITLFVTSQRVFIVVSLYSVIDSVRKLLDAPSYSKNMVCGQLKSITFLQTQLPVDWVSGLLSPRIRCPVLEADRSLPCIAEVRMRGALHPLPHTSSWRVI